MTSAIDMTRIDVLEKKLEEIKPIVLFTKNAHFKVVAEPLKTRPGYWVEVYNLFNGIGPYVPYVGKQFDSLNLAIHVQSHVLRVLEETGKLPTDFHKPMTVDSLYVPRKSFL